MDGVTKKTKKKENMIGRDKDKKTNDEWIG